MKNTKLLIILLITIISLSVGCNNDKNNELNNKNDTIVENVNEPPIILDEEESGIDFWTALFLIMLSVGIGVGTFYVFKKWIPLGLWYKAWLSDVKVSWVQLIKMYWRAIPQEEVLLLLIKAKNAGLDLSIKELEDKYLAGVDLTIIIEALIKAENSKLDITFEELTRHYLAKVDIDILLEALIIAISADINTNIDELANLYHREVDIVRIVKVKMTAKNSGFPVHFYLLVEHFLAGGHIEKTVEAYIAAKKANLSDFEFKDIANIDLAGYDVIASVDKAITPTVVETSGVRGIARDGVEMTLKVKVTLRAKIADIIGGAEEQTVLARVNEALATEIGLAVSHYDILQSPYMLADTVEKKDLHLDSAFHIVSVDVSDIKVGTDVHSELKSERAKASADEAKANLIKAEEKVQKAIAAAFLDGNLSIHQYHEMMNTEADTRMRDRIGKKDAPKNEHEKHNKHNEEHDENENNKDHKNDDHH